MIQNDSKWFKVVRNRWKWLEMDLKPIYRQCWSGKGQEFHNKSLVRVPLQRFQIPNLAVQTWQFKPCSPKFRPQAHGETLKEAETLRKMPF